MDEEGLVDEHLLEHVRVDTVDAGGGPGEVGGQGGGPWSYQADEVHNKVAKVVVPELAHSPRVNDRVPRV